MMQTADGLVEEQRKDPSRGAGGDVPNKLDANGDKIQYDGASPPAGNRCRVKSRASKHRRLQNSCRSNVIVAVKVVLLFAVAAGYFLSSFAIEQEEFLYQSKLMPEHTYLMRRNTMMHDIAYLTRQLALAPLMQQDFRPESAAAVAGTQKLIGNVM